MLPIRIFLVDDSPVFLDSVTCFLSADPVVEVVGRALSGAGALERISSLQPDLVLMDLSMPEMSGLETTRLIKARTNAPPKVLILTLHDHPRYREASRVAGADGFVSKAEVGTQLIPQIRTLFGAIAADGEKPGGRALRRQRVHIQITDADRVDSCFDRPIGGSDHTMNPARTTRMAFFALVVPVDLSEYGRSHAVRRRVRNDPRV